MITTTDSGTEENIPGLNATDPRKVQRAIPNLEHWSPLLTMIAPFLPITKEVTDAIGIRFPNHWPLATTGPTGDWLNMTAFAWARAMTGTGPQSLFKPTALVALPEAYKKLSEQLKEFSGLPPVAEMDYIKKAMAVVATYHQLTMNMQIVKAPQLLGQAENNTILVTQGKTKLKLIIKEDGSRYLKSNTTTAKLVKTDVKVGPFTVQLVDSFIVPKISLLPPKPDPLFTEEDLRKWPEEWKMIQEAYAAMPKAASEMPAAMKGMIVRQLKPEQQALFKKVDDKLSAKLKAWNQIKIFDIKVTPRNKTLA